MREYNRIKALRKEKGYSRKKLADLIGCGSSTITDWEHPYAPRRIKPCYYDALSTIFGLPIDEMIWVEEHTKRVALVEFNLPSPQYSKSNIPRKRKTIPPIARECRYCSYFSRFEDSSRFGRCRVNRKIRYHSDDCTVKGKGFSARKNTKRKK